MPRYCSNPIGTSTPGTHVPEMHLTGRVTPSTTVVSAQLGLQDWLELPCVDSAMSCCTVVCRLALISSTDLYSTDALMAKMASSMSLQTSGDTFPDSSSSACRFVMVTTCGSPSFPNMDSDSAPS